VTDPGGAVVPGAKVTLTQPSTGSSKVINTTGSGYYSAGSLVPGDYVIRVEAPGFQTTTVSLTVRVGVVTNGDVKMQVGTTTQQVEVQANAIGIDTQQTQIAGVSLDRNRHPADPDCRRFDPGADRQFASEWP
jgi:hypothetical protein